MSQVNAFLDGLRRFAVIMHYLSWAVSSDNEEYFGKYYSLSKTSGSREASKYTFNNTLRYLPYLYTGMQL